MARPDVGVPLGAAEGVGFEPTGGLPPCAFKAHALGHYANPPRPRAAAPGGAPIISGACRGRPHAHVRRWPGGRGGRRSVGATATACRRVRRDQRQITAAAAAPATPAAATVP